MGLFILLFVARCVGALVLGNVEELTSPGAVVHAMLTLALVASERWIALGRIGRRALQFIDLAAVVAIGVLSANALRLSQDPALRIRVLVLLALTLCSRAAILPSRSRWTVFVSFAGLMPVVLADYYFSAHVESRLAGLIEMLVWGGLITLAAAQIGSLIYGLRHQVRAFTRQGQYEIVQLIGKGGMGAVYEARHALLRRRTALKLLPPREADGDSIRRFEREARLASRLPHPNPISLFAFRPSPRVPLSIDLHPA